MKNDKKENKSLIQASVRPRTFRIGELVKFNVISDDSDYASNCFGVEAQNDWFDIQVYTEELFGEIVKRNTIEIIYTDGKRSGKFFKIKNGIIEKELNKLLQKKSEYNISLSQIFDGSDLKTIKDFKKITTIPFIELTSLRNKGSVENPPKKNVLVEIRRPYELGSKLLGYSKYENGKWSDLENIEDNNEPKIIDNNCWWFADYKYDTKRIFINGKIFVEDSGF